MLKSFIKDALIYALPTLLSRGIVIFLLPIYTHIALPKELGALDMFLVFGNIVVLTVALEISQSIARFIPEINKLKTRLQYNSTGLFFTLAMYSCFFILAYVYSYELNSFITGIDEFQKTFQLAIVYITLNGIFCYFQNLLRFEGKSIAYSTLSIIYAASNLVSAYLFGIICNYGFEGILYSMITSVFTSCILGIYLLKDSFDFIFNVKILIKMLKFSIPLVPASALVFLSLYIDRYMISLFLNLESVGQYGVAFRLASAGSLILIGFQMAITPLVYKHYNDPNTPNELATIFRYFVIFSVFFFLIYSLIAKELLMLLTTPDFYTVANVVPLLVLALFFSNMYVFMPGISIRKKTYLIFGIGVVTCIINFLLNYYLIPIFSIQGAAFATAIGYFISFLMFVHFSQKLYYVPHAWSRLVILFVLTLIFVFLYYSINFDISFLQAIFLRLLILLIIIGLTFNLRLISKVEIIAFKNGIENKLRG